MKKSVENKLIIFSSCLCFIVAFFIAGCNKSEQNQKGPEIQKQSAEGNMDLQKAPDELENIEEGIEKIIQELGGPAKSKEESEKTEEGKDSQDNEKTDKKMESGQKEDAKSENKQSDSEKESGSGTKKEGQNEESTEKKEGQSEDSSENKEGEKNKEQGEDGKSDESDNQNKGKSKEEADEKGSQKDPWQKISSTIDKLHYEWSSYTPKAVKSGANSQLIDNFSKALNNLTTSAKDKNMQNTLLSANHLYGYLPDFHMLYKEQNSPEIKRVRYFIRNSALYSDAGDWEKCDLNIKSLKSSWSLYKNTLNNEIQELASKLDFSIYELEKVVNERDQQLIDIKSRVALSNVDALEEAAKKPSKDGSKQSESGGEGSSGGKSGGGGEG